MPNALMAGYRKSGIRHTLYRLQPRSIATGSVPTTTNLVLQTNAKIRAIKVRAINRQLNNERALFSQQAIDRIQILRLQGAISLAQFKTTDQDVVTRFG
jgi:hypothetical protein